MMAIHPVAAEGRYQGGMNIHDAIMKVLGNFQPQHESGKHHQVNLVKPDGPPDGFVKRRLPVKVTFCHRVRGNTVPAGSLNEGWGQTAGFAAEAAAEGIFALVDQARGASTVQ